MSRPVDATAASAVIGRLDALLELTRVSYHPIDEVLRAVAEVVVRVVGFTTVVVNLYRPAWDDYEVVVVHGSDAARHALLHTVNSRHVWEDEVLDTAHERVAGAFFLDADDPDAWEGVDRWFTPPTDVTVSGPDRWRPDDGLFAALRSSDTTLLGVLSVDLPLSGSRPTVTDLEMLVAVANHASAALEAARHAAEAERHRQTLAALLQVSTRLASQTTVDGILDQVCTGTVPALGFETVSVYLHSGPNLEPRARRNTTASGPDDTAPIEVDTVAALLDAHAEHGCVLVKSSEVIPGAVPSQRNGRGQLAWNDHRLLVPMHAPRGALTGLVVFDNPTDRLLPDAARCQALRLLADNAAAAVESIERQSHVEYLAAHDPLTGVLNRRGFHNTINALAARPAGVSVLMCDLDNFKAVNDRLGHNIGDQARQRFGTVLRAQARADDIPVRTGGEEFCLLLPQVDARGAMIAAERLRHATATAMTDIAPGLTVSIGTATSGPRTPDAGSLLAAADLALYAAKAAGRNRSRNTQT